VEANKAALKDQVEARGALANSLVLNEKLLVEQKADKDALVVLRKQVSIASHPGVPLCCQWSAISTVSDRWLAFCMPACLCFLVNNVNLDSASAWCSLPGCL
jgi:hypothetical protein